MTTKRATADALDEMHKVIATELTDIIKNGEVDPETGGRKKASAAYFANAIKFLKDNNIAGVITEKSPLADLLKTIESSDILEEIHNQTRH